MPYYCGEKPQAIDGGILEPLGLTTLLRHNKGKLIIVLNYPLHYPFRAFRHTIKNFFEGALASMLFPNLNLRKQFFQRITDFRKDLNYLRKHKEIKLISPPENNETYHSTTAPAALIETYLLGKQAGLQLVQQLTKTKT